MHFEISDHARSQMRERDIEETLVRAVLDHPDQIVPEYGGRQARQSRLVVQGRTFLLRVIVDERVQPPLMVIVYRTSRIAKYWKT